MMHIILKDPACLKPYARNARKHSAKQISQIAASIQQFGFNNPILIDPDLTIVAGHGRWEAAKKLKLKEVPTIRLDHLSEVEIRAYILADNKLAELAGWDQEILSIELQYLTALDLNFDLEITGFEMGEIDFMIDGPVSKKLDPADTIVEPATDQPAITKPGNLWILGNHRLLCGNSLEPDSYAILMGADRAQMVFTDPPYNVPINGHVCGSGSIKHREFEMGVGEWTSAEFTDFLSNIMNLMKIHTVTLSFDGKLLDGNRRFFAIKYALETMPSTDPNRQDLESVDVHILNQDATEEDEQNVLVEENFSASLKIEWPDYVKAMMVVDASESGLTPEEISKKFNWNKSKIKETLKINEIISEFITFATSPKDQNDESGGGLGLSEHEAETIAAKNYQYFNEAQKSIFEPIKTDFDFKIQFFKWIYDGKFSSFPEVRVAYTAWKHPEAKAALMQPEPTAAKSAKAILDYNSRVVRSTDEAVGRIDSFVKFLSEMTAAEMKLLPSSSRESLEKAMEMIVKMSKAAAE